MCTIGWVRDGEAVYTFKQCDLTTPTTFFEPQTVSGQAGEYLAFRRLGRPGIWAGINEWGVGFVAADYYTNEDPGSVSAPAVRFEPTSTHTGESSPVDALFHAYEESIANHTTAADAIAFLSDWYLTKGNPGGDPPNFQSPDIVLLSDPTGAVFLEYYPGDEPGQAAVLTLAAGESWFASTNHARMFTQTVDYSKNHSTYLRLARAEAILKDDPSHGGIRSVLHDQYYGATELSICRIAAQAGQYYTQATVVTKAREGRVSVEYIINGNPRTKMYRTKEL